MPGDPKPDEWRLLKDQFDALRHVEGVPEDSIDTLFDELVRRRFAEWIARAAQRGNQN